MIAGGSIGRVSIIGGLMGSVLIGLGRVGVLIGLGRVAVGTGVAVRVAVGMGVAVRVAVGMGVAVRVAVGMGVAVRVAVGLAEVACGVVSSPVDRALTTPEKTLPM